MPSVHVKDAASLDITVTLEDATTMIRHAAQNISAYASDIVTIYEKMPEFEYTHFCFYAYDSAVLFEKMLGLDPKQYTTFSLSAPDSFFYALYGGMSGLVQEARRHL